MKFDFAERSHQRLNPLTGEWILVSSQRLQRPWQGRIELPGLSPSQSHVSDCYLCPRNIRAGGRSNPDYSNTFVFDNDFSALTTAGDPGQFNLNDLLVARAEPGICRVVCYSPCHNLSLAEMSTAQIADIATIWKDQYLELSGKPGISHVQIFENKGELMGCSNPHPHGQIWATATIPTEPFKEDETQRDYSDSHSGARLLGSVLELELSAGERIVCANDRWVALVPFWAKWPFEILVLPRKPIAHLGELDPTQSIALAGILREVTTRYDNLFETSFPYTMGIHQAPSPTEAFDHWTIHIHFYPPLLRSATIQKFMVGYELLAEAQRDLTPENAAARLRDLPVVHYRQRQ
ncbi:MAG: UDP-glucose--hexose-1-phosphate uridylyltransferase [Candidatus Sumerlaeaceae bacterium]|nr:UDP-glucose--hexose-1-phosphate uridylyltransferase [Candidatus Sumerlaeaceae bacterium]